MVDIAFIGFVDQAAHVPNPSAANLVVWNALGLRLYFLTPFIPALLRGARLAFAMRDVADQQISIHIRSISGSEVGLIQFSTQALPVTSDPTQEISLTASTPILDVPQGWQIIVIPMSADVLAPEAGLYELYLQTNDGEKSIGAFHIMPAAPSILTEERIAAIRSDPHAAKAVRMRIGCKECDGAVKVYAALERTPKLGEENWTWYTELPDQFQCTCGKTIVDLRQIRANLHLLLGYRQIVLSENVSLVPLYEQSTFTHLYDTFGRLLNSDPKEETIQKFIEQNPIILHEYPAVRIIFKPQILTKHRADFGIVTPQKELILIEIEHTRTRLLRKNGGEASELSHAVDQVEDWLRIADDHRAAFLAELSIEPDQVSTVRGVVIAGRDRGQDAKHLRSLRGRNRGRVSFRTFDDLLYSVGALARDMVNL